MTAKQTGAAVLGSLALLAGILMSVAVLRRLLLVRFDNAWSIADAAMAFAISAYLIWVAVRALWWSKGRVDTRKRKVKWGMVLFGAMMIYSGAKNLAIPNTPGMLQPSNETQAEAAHATTVVLMIVGALLLISGVVPRFRSEREAPDASKLNQVAGPSEQ